MLKVVRTDLENVCDDLEHLQAQLPRLTLKEKVDVCARLRAACKTIKAMDEEITAEMKKLRRGKAGYVIGEVFKAFVNICPTTRLDQTALKLDLPDLFNKYTKTDDVVRVTFEAR